jgi:multicomponent Na+:H+ antiporter subunit C
MVYLLAIVAGTLFAAGLYMLLKRSLVKVLVGIMLLSYAVNLLIFTSARMVPGRPPLIPVGLNAPANVPADPVPQALILTAIVISFGVTAFGIILIRQAYQVIGSDDLNDMRCTDLPCASQPDDEDHLEEAEQS